MFFTLTTADREGSRRTVTAARDRPERVVAAQPLDGAHGLLQGAWPVRVGRIPSADGAARGMADRSAGRPDQGFGAGP
ncbi:hypothetical protein B9S64_15820 [Streptomyces sp. SM18]|nr:hypothetical protein B9S64_15820 [Streptomyces sp. SM18]